MSIFDLIALLVLLGAAIVGARSGLSILLLGLAGSLGALALAVALSAVLHGEILAVGQPLRAVLVLGGLVALLAVGESIGGVLGARMAIGFRRIGLGVVDAAGGVLLGIIHGVLVLWLAIGFLVAIGPPGLQGAIRTSVAAQTIRRSLPPPAQVASALIDLLDASGIPDLFAAGEPSPAPPVDLPSQPRAAELARSGQASTVEINAFGCGGEQIGTGFFVTGSVVVTNAHVVAGTDRVVVLSGTSRFDATLTLFDPRTDLALLRLVGASGPPLQLAGAPPARGTQGVALGHPLGGPLTAIPAAITARYQAVGPDIYGSGSVTRSVLELRADVQRGDSGGPLLVAPGVVGGIVFGASRTSGGVGYALSASAVSQEITTGSRASAPVSSGACTTG